MYLNVLRKYYTFTFYNSYVCYAKPNYVSNECKWDIAFG